MQQPTNPQDEMRKMSRRSFIWAGLAVLGSVSAFTWIGTRSPVAGIQGPLRQVHDWNDEIMRTLFRDYRLEPELSLAKITPEPRTNGHVGEIDEIPEDFKLSVMTPDMELHELTLDELKAMPSKEMTTEFRCVEGWDQVVNWKGVPLREVFRAVMKGQSALPSYAKLETADSEYFVGLDIESALHPQTILAYEMNGKTLPLEHGAPIRLVIPVKYGIKNMKWLAQITFTNAKPDDYWADRGYTWYGGL